MNINNIFSPISDFPSQNNIALFVFHKLFQDIVHGLNMSVASKIYSLIRRLNCESDFIMTGGVSKNEGVVNAIQAKLGHKIFTFKNSQLCGAIGVALLGMN